MALTTAAGLKGNVLGTYKYCGGINETARRKAQIDAGTYAFSIWAPKAVPVKRPRKSKATMGGKRV